MTAYNMLPFRVIGAIVGILLGLQNVIAAVSPWCDEPGNPQFTLSIERMAQGELFSPEVRRHPVKALQAILNSFERSQQQLIDQGVITGSSAETRAFVRILQAQINGENLKPYFQFSTVGNKAKLFWPRETLAVEFDCESETPLKLEISNPQKVNIGYASYLVFAVLSEQLQVIDQFYDARLKQRADQYYRFMSEGFPMWPWELAINGWGESYADLLKGPPKWQWVVMRPSAGFEVYWPSRQEAKLEASIGIEPLGIVRYSDDSYKKWWGVSTLVTLGTEDNGAALGGLIRYNNYSFGIVKRQGVDDHYIFISIDLYDKVRSTQTQVNEAKQQLDELKQAWQGR